MTNETASKVKEPSQLDQILSRLSAQNSNLVSTIQELESVGHRVRNTNFPRVDDGSKKEEVKPEGLLDEIGLQLNYFEGHNYRLQELLKKLSPLL